MQEHAYCDAVEKLAPVAAVRAVSTVVGLSRLIFDELSRLMNHLLTLGATCLDVGSMGPIF